MRRLFVALLLVALPTALLAQQACFWSTCAAPVPAQCMGASAGTSATPSTAGTFSSISLADRSWALTNGTLVCKIGLYSTGANSGMKVFVILENGGASNTRILIEDLDHPGGGWADKVLTTPYLVPSTGTYRAGGYWATTSSVGINGSTPFGFVSGVASGTQTWTEGTGNSFATRAFR